jgi:hypothetical protein
MGYFDETDRNGRSLARAPSLFDFRMMRKPSGRVARGRPWISVIEEGGTFARSDRLPDPFCFKPTANAEHGSFPHRRQFSSRLVLAGQEVHAGIST